MRCEPQPQTQPLPCGKPLAGSSGLPRRQSQWLWHRTAQTFPRDPCGTCGDRGSLPAPHPTPGHPKGSPTSPPELPAQLELGFIPKSSWAGSLHTLTLPQRTIFLWISHLILIIFNKSSKFPLLEGRPDWAGSAKPFALPVGPFEALSSGYSCSNTSPRNVTWIMLLVALLVL